MKRNTTMAFALFLFSFAQLSPAQPPFPPGPQGPPPPAKAIAPEDLTGYWVSMVTEDWRYRMLTPAKGDFAGVPLSFEGRQVANQWDPAKDETAGEACRSYGAPALMRVPTRLHIAWQDDNILKVETDAGMQTRLFNFTSEVPSQSPPSWQGFSIASWDMPRPGRGPGGPGGRGPGGRGPAALPLPTPVVGASGQRAGSLKVLTTNLKAGYLRKNGVPYSANARLTEYYSRINDADGTSWLIVTSIVDDPKYLAQPFMTSANFKLQADGKGWDPQPCSAR